MKRVSIGEHQYRLRHSVADQLTENPERMPLGVSAFLANVLSGLEIGQRGRERGAVLSDPDSVLTDTNLGPEPLF